MDSPRIALLTEEFPPFTFGGIASFCNDLAHHLSEKRVTTTVFSGKSKKIAEQKVNDYLTIVRLPCFDFVPRFFWFQFLNSARLLRLLRDYDVIHCVNPQVSLIGAYAKTKLGKPLVTSFHGVPFHELKIFGNSPLSYWTAGDFGYNVLEYPLNEFFIRQGLNHSDSIMTCSYTTLNELRSKYRKRRLDNASVIYNGVNIHEINRLNQAVQPNHENNPTLIYCGRLYWLKGIIYLIKAFEILTPEFPNLRLKILGEGPLKNRIRTLVSDLDLKEKVQITGQVPHAQALTEVIKSDIAVFPSLHEAQPIAVLEAMACRKPVVVFDFDFAREYVKDKSNGLLANPYDERDLADKIRMLLSDGRLLRRLGENAHQHVRESHNWDTLINKYIKVYQNVADAAANQTKIYTV
jgi:glycosyltransferase involved in cell wall biosynthesis